MAISCLLFYTKSGKIAAASAATLFRRCLLELQYQLVLHLPPLIVDIVLVSSPINKNLTCGYSTPPHN